MDKYRDVYIDARSVIIDIERASKAVANIERCDGTNDILSSAKDAIDSLDDAKKRLICLVNRASKIR